MARGLSVEVERGRVERRAPVGARRPARPRGRRAPTRSRRRCRAPRSPATPRSPRARPAAVAGAATSTPRSARDLEQQRPRDARQRALVGRRAERVALPPQQAVQRALEQPARRVAQQRARRRRRRRPRARRRSSSGRSGPLRRGWRAQVARLGDETRACSMSGGAGRRRSSSRAGDARAPAALASRSTRGNQRPAAGQRRGRRGAEGARAAPGSMPSSSHQPPKRAQCAVVAAHAALVDEPRIGRQQRARGALVDGVQLAVAPDQDRVGSVVGHRGAAAGPR